jgi:hypothetical protein
VIFCQVARENPERAATVESHPCAKGRARMGHPASDGQRIQVGVIRCAKRSDPAPETLKAAYVLLTSSVFLSMADLSSCFCAGVGVSLNSGSSNGGSPIRPAMS